MMDRAALCLAGPTNTEPVMHKPSGAPTRGGKRELGTATGTTLLSEWLSENAGRLGRSYRSELKRHYG